PTELYTLSLHDALPIYCRDIFPGKMSAPHSPTQNRLLAALPAAEFDRLSPQLELVPMPLGEALYESGGKLQHVYFPTTSIVSLLDRKSTRLNSSHDQIS